LRPRVTAFMGAAVIEEVRTSCGPDTMPAPPHPTSHPWASKPQWRSGAWLVLLNGHNAMGRRMHPIGLQCLGTNRPEPVANVGRKHERDAWLERNELTLVLHPRLTLAFQDRDAFHVGVRVNGRSVSWRRRLNSNPDRGGAVQIADQRLIGRS